jgi:hypothetical protein
VTFLPQGLTQVIVLGSSASPPLQISSGSVQGVRFRISGGVQCEIAIGTSTVSAEAGSSSAVFDSFSFGTISLERMTVPPNAWISALTTGSTVTGTALYITPGIGL